MTAQVDVCFSDGHAQRIRATASTEWLAEENLFSLGSLMSISEPIAEMLASVEPDTPFGELLMVHMASKLLVVPRTENRDESLLLELELLRLPVALRKVSQVSVEDLRQAHEHLLLAGHDETAVHKTLWLLDDVCSYAEYFELNATNPVMSYVAQRCAVSAMRSSGGAALGCTKPIVTVEEL